MGSIQIGQWGQYKQIGHCCCGRVWFRTAFWCWPHLDVWEKCIRKKLEV